MNAFGRGQEIQAQGAGDALGDGALCCVEVDRDFAVGQIARADIAEDRIGIGQRRFGAAAAVARWPGHRACRARAYPQSAGPVEVGY